MAHAQKTRFRLSAKRTSPFKSAGGRQFSRLLAAEVCASRVVMLDTPCSEVVWRVLATCSIRQFPVHFPSCASPCAITFQLDSTAYLNTEVYSCLSCDLRADNSNRPALTLRRLMSYIYMEHPFLMFLDHTQRRSTVGRTPLDE